MRNLFIILVLLMLSPFYSIGQRMNDTLVMYVDQRMEMQIILSNYKNLKIDSNQQKVRKQLEVFQNKMKEINPSLDPNKAELITFLNEKEIKVSEGDPSEIYLIEDGVQASGVRDKALIKVDEMRINLTSTDMKLLDDLNLLQCFDQMIDKIPHNSRYAKTFYFECSADSVVLLADKEEVHSQGDLLEISGGGAINLYKGQWLGELGLRLDIELFKKNVLQHNPYLTWSFLYDFSDLSKMRINQFLSVGYSWDRNRGEGEENVFGVELGFLVGRSGDLFEKNTTRLGINWSPVKGVTVSPQMYIIGDFEKVQPGFRVGLGF